MSFNNETRIRPRENSQKTKPQTKTKNNKLHLKRNITTLRLFRTSLLYQTREFFNNSTLHGVRYIAETGRPFAERFMWFCFTAVGFVSALVIIVSLWEKFQTNPTITGLDMDVHNQQIVFPTIVVCPVDPYDGNRTNDLAYSYLGGYEEENARDFEPFLRFLPQLSYENMQKAYEESQNITMNENHRKVMGKRSLRSLAFQVNIFCNDTFELCKYRDEEIKCCDHFYPLYSEHGFCFAFNPRYIDSHDSETRNQHFHDLFETDKKWALFFTPRRESRIFVHSHFENFGFDFRPHIVWQDDFAAELLISMKQTYTTEDAKQLSIGQRKCIFPDEVKLEIYDEEYTFTSCMKECRLKKSMKLCRCIPPFYKPIASMPYCKVEDLACLAKYATNITDVRDCYKCELSCANTVYDIEKLSKTTADSTKTVEKFVNIEYLTWPIIRYKREVLFGWVDLLVSFGGIAGLFLGFSLLSGVEIVYYFTLRACCMLYKNRDELYEIEEQKLLKPQEHVELSLSLIKERTTSSDSIADKKIDVLERDKNEVVNKIKLKNNTVDNVLLGSGWNARDIGNTNTIPRRISRAALKLEAAKAFARPGYKTRNPTSYDYSKATGPVYIP